MSRLREPAAAPRAGRDFTRGELARIRVLTLFELDWHRDGWPNRRTAELGRIHAAAGRVRGFMLWELCDAREHDPEAAYREETGTAGP